MTFVLRTLSFFILLSPFCLRAQEAEPVLAEARRLAHEGRFESAISRYRTFLVKNPDHREATLGLADALSWSGNYQDGATAYRKALAGQPGDIAALSGLGYALAWGGRYREAEAAFRRILDQDARHAEGRKGMGYVQLWRGRGKQAAGWFGPLATEQPGSEEFHLALGLSHLADYRSKAARAEFDKAVAIRPDSDARLFRRAADLKMGYLELDLWGSYARRDGEGSVGLRDVMLGWQALPQLRLFARYDDALSTDYLALLPTAGKRAPAFALGAMTDFKGVGISRMEVGRRQIDGQPNQTFALLEHAYLLRGNANVRVGAVLVAPEDRPTEWTPYVGGRLPIGAYFALEPAVFFGMPAGDKSAKTRGLMALNWRSATGYSITAGAVLGTSDPEDPNQKPGFVRQRYVFALMPVHPNLWLMATVRDEPGLAQRLFHFDLGVKVRIER